MGAAGKQHARPSIRPLRLGVGAHFLRHTARGEGLEASKETGSLCGGAGCGGYPCPQPLCWVSFDEDGRCRIGDDLRAPVP